MSDETGNTEPTVESRPITRTIIGIVLLVIGLYIAFWTVSRVAEIMLGDEVPSITAKLMPVSDNDGVITLPEGKIQIPRQFWVVLGYLFSVLLLSITTAIACALISGGVSLLQPDFHATLRKLGDQLSRLSRR